MAVYSVYKRQHILYYYFRGYKAPSIARLLRGEKLSASRWGVHKFLTKYHETGSISRRPGSGRPSKVTWIVKWLVEQQMQLDDETTAHQLHALLLRNGIQISFRTILRCRSLLGWTFRGSAYCQLIRHANKERQLEWARKNINLEFNNVVWTDECSLQLESHWRFCCRKHGQPPKHKPRYVLLSFWYIYLHV